ncbi:MAG: 50S ribosomal protein L10 [Phycisphaeraceae bacterium]|nr:50S ribosomal protein L10 [Phycisphaeraceae bacterium]
MSKPVKNLIINQYKERFESLEGAVVIDMRGIKSNDNNALRTALAGEGIRVTVLSNLLARHAIRGTALESLSPVLEGSCAMAYGANSVVDLARTLLVKQNEMKVFEFKGAVLEGQLYGADEIEKLSKMPTREEAIAGVIGAALSAGSNLMATVTAAGGNVMGVVKTIEEKLEKGETIARQAG